MRRVLLISLLMLGVLASPAHASRYWLSKVCGTGFADDPSHPCLSSKVTHYQMALTWRNWTVLKTDDESFTTNSASFFLLPNVGLDSVVGSLATRTALTDAGVLLDIPMPTMTSTTTLRQLIEQTMTTVDPLFKVADWFASPKVGNTIYLNQQFNTASIGLFDIGFEQIGAGSMDSAGGVVVSRQTGQSGPHRETTTLPTDDYFVSAVPLGNSVAVWGRVQLSSASGMEGWRVHGDNTNRILALNSVGNSNAIVLSSAGSWTAGDQITLEVNGNTRTLYWNGGSMGSSSANSAFPTGTTGFSTIAGVASGSNVLDSFCVATTLAEARNQTCSAAVVAGGPQVPAGGPSGRSFFGVGQ